jgi:hypothetical protein
MIGSKPRVTFTEGFNPAVAEAFWRDKLHLLSHRLDRKKAQYCELGEQLHAALAARSEAEEGTALWIVRDRAARKIKDDLLSVLEELRPLELEVVETQLTLLAMVAEGHAARAALSVSRRAADTPVESAPPYWGDAHGWMLNQAKANRKLQRKPTLAACKIETGASREKIRDAWGKLPNHLKNEVGRPLKSV